MSTSPAVRRRATWVALATTAVLVVAALTATWFGIRTLADSQAGRDVSDRSQELLLPATPTALLGTVSDDGELTGLVALVLRPEGVGGSVVSISATADSTLGIGDVRTPLRSTYATGGPEILALEAESLAGVSFDVVELASTARLAELLAPMTPLEVEMPVEVVGADGEVIVAAGAQTLDAEQVARVLTAVGPDGSIVVADPARDAVWAAIADSIGDGRGSASPAPDGEDPEVPASLDEFVEQLRSGQVAWRNLAYAVPEGIDDPAAEVLVPDRAEILVVFGQIAPARVATPNDSLTFRIEAGFTDDELEVVEANNTDVVRDLVRRLLISESNVVSVQRLADEAPDVTVLYVDETLVTEVGEAYELVFGEVEVRVAETRIRNVDVVVVLGRSYLDVFAQGPSDGSEFETTESSDQEDG